MLINNNSDKGIACLCICRLYLSIVFSYLLQNYTLVQFCKHNYAFGCYERKHITLKILEKKTYLHYKQSYNGQNEENLFKAHIEILNAFSRIIGQSFFVADYNKQKFIYVSAKPLFLCGYTEEEVVKMGYSFFREAVVKEDIELMMEADKKWHEFFNLLSDKEKQNFTVSFDYRLKQPGGDTILINQKNSPVFQKESEKPKFTLSIINLSVNSHSGNMIATLNDSNLNYKYSFATKRWNQVTPIQLSKREREILLLSSQGFSNKRIADTLFIDISTVKFHKSNIFPKLNVKNIMEAVRYANNYKLL